MFLRKPVDLKPYHNEFSQVDLIDSKGHDLQGGSDPQAPEVPVQVKDIIELFHFQGLEQGIHVTIQDMDFIDKRISPDHGKKFLFGKKMHLCILYLFFQAA